MDNENQSSENPTNPDNLKPTLDDLISSLIGTAARLDVQFAEFQSKPPEWMQEWMLQITQRIEKIENTCNKNHNNFFNKTLVTM